MKDHIQNEHEMDGYAIVTCYDPHGDESDDEWGWFWGISIERDPVFVGYDEAGVPDFTDDNVFIDKSDFSRVGELGPLNFGPFATEDAALSAAKSAWLDVLGAPGAADRYSEISLEKWAAHNAFVRGVTMEEYERLNEQGIH